LVRQLQRRLQRQLQNRIRQPFSRYDEKEGSNL